MPLAVVRDTKLIFSVILYQILVFSGFGKKKKGVYLICECRWWKRKEDRKKERKKDRILPWCVSRGKMMPIQQQTVLNDSLPLERTPH